MATQPNVHTKPTEKSDPSDINNDNPNLDETQTEKTKHPTEIQMKSMKILIMNASDKHKMTAGTDGPPPERRMKASGKSQKAGTDETPTNTDEIREERRKHAIHDVVEKHMPNIILFQEFKWPGITDKNREEYPFQEQFVYAGHVYKGPYIKDHVYKGHVYKGHSHASIMHDKTCITVEDILEQDLCMILDELQITPNNRLNRAFPPNFDHVARMSMLVVTAKTNPDLKFICISWHGRANKIETQPNGSMSNDEKIVYFECWLELLRIVKEKYKLPILAGGDYNVRMSSIETLVQTPFKLCKYKASKRRKAHLIDYCIVTDDLEFTDITWVDLENDTTANNPNDILDHDPIVGSLTASVTAAAPAADTTASESGDDSLSESGDDSLSESGDDSLSKSGDDSLTTESREQ